MVSVTLTVGDKAKQEMGELRWVNWSEAGREVLLAALGRNMALHELEELFKNSTLTDEDCMELGEQLKDEMYRRLKTEGKL